MSNQDESRLSRILHDRAHDVSGAHLELDDVRRSAHGIRRRRRVLTGLVAAAAVAVAVPVGITAAGRTGTDRPVGPAATPSRPAASAPPSTAASTPSPTPTLPQAEGLLPLTATGAARGGPPQVGYLRGRTVHLAPDSAVELPSTYSSVTPYHGGFLAADFAKGEEYVVELDNTFAEVSRQPGSSRFALSADGTRVSWFTEDANGRTGLLHRAIPSGMSDEVTDQKVPGGMQFSPVGFVSSDEVVYERFDDRPQVGVTDFAGSTRRLEGLLAAGGTSQEEGLVSGMVSVSDNGSCWVVRPASAGEELWKTCDYSLGQFSPDGRYVLAGPAYRDGIGDGDVAVLDAHTGDVVAHWRCSLDGTAFVSTSVWEDGTDVLTPLYEDGTWHLLRLNVSGAISETLDPVTADMDHRPWNFLPRP
jgi:hypothetical protein